MEKFKLIIIGILSILISYLNKISLLLFILLFLNLLDIITGIFRTIYFKEKFKFNVFIWGFIKKISMYFLITIGLIIDIVMDYTVENLNLSISLPEMFGGLIAIWLILNEQLSILKNLILINIPMPDFIVNTIQKFKKNIDLSNYNSKDK